LKFLTCVRYACLFSEIKIVVSIMRLPVGSVKTYGNQEYEQYGKDDCKFKILVTKH